MTIILKDFNYNGRHFDKVGFTFVGTTDIEDFEKDTGGKIPSCIKRELDKMPIDEES